MNAIERKLNAHLAAHPFEDLAPYVLRWTQRRLKSGWAPREEPLRYHAVLVARCAQSRTFVTIDDEYDENDEAIKVLRDSAPWIFSSDVDMTPHVYERCLRATSRLSHRSAETRTWTCQLTNGVRLDEDNKGSIVKRLLADDEEDDNNTAEGLLPTPFKLLKLLKEVDFSAFETLVRRALDDSPVWDPDLSYELLPVDVMQLRVVARQDWAPNRRHGALGLVFVAPAEEWLNGHREAIRAAVSEEDGAANVKATAIAETIASKVYHDGFRTGIFMKALGVLCFGGTGRADQFVLTGTRAVVVESVVSIQLLAYQLCATARMTRGAPQGEHQLALCACTRGHQRDCRPTPRAISFWKTVMVDRQLPLRGGFSGEWVRSVAFIFGIDITTYVLMTQNDDKRLRYFFSSSVTLDCEDVLLTLESERRHHDWHEARALLCGGCTRGLSVDETYRFCQALPAHTEYWALAHLLMLPDQAAKKDFLRANYSNVVATSFAHAVFVLSKTAAANSAGPCVDVDETLTVLRSQLLDKGALSVLAAPGLAPLHAVLDGLLSIDEVVLGAVRATPRSELWPWTPIPKTIADFIAPHGLLWSERRAVLGGQRVRHRIASGFSTRHCSEIWIGPELVALATAAPPGVCLRPGTFRGREALPGVRDVLETLVDKAGAKGTAALYVAACEANDSKPTTAVDRTSELWLIVAHGDFDRHIRHPLLVYPETSQEWTIVAASAAVRLAGPARPDRDYVVGAPMRLAALLDVYSLELDKKTGHRAFPLLEQVFTRLKVVARGITPDSEADHLVARALIQLRELVRSNQGVAGGIAWWPHEECCAPCRGTACALPAEKLVVPVDTPLGIRLMETQTLHEARSALAAVREVDELMDAHADLDRAGADVRRRLVNQAALAWVFGTVPSCGELCAVVMARGGLGDDDAPTTTRLAWLELLLYSAPELSGTGRKRKFRR